MVPNYDSSIDVIFWIQIYFVYGANIQHDIFFFFAQENIQNSFHMTDCFELFIVVVENSKLETLRNWMLWLDLYIHTF